MPMIECYCSPISMWSVLVSLGMELTSISNSCEFVKVYSHDVPTVICMVVNILFSLGAIVRRYMDVDPLSTTPELLLLFYIFGDGGC